MATSITNALVTSSGSTSSGSGSSSTNNTSGYGLGQGIDVNQFVQLALANDQATITNLQNQQGTFGTQTSTLSRITSDLNALQSTVTALRDPLGAMNALTASSSNSSVLSATAANTATPGTHTISITSLATTSSYYSDPAPTSSTTLTGSLQISVGGGAAVSVPVDSTDNTTTLSGLASYINSHSNLGVTASVVQDANGARLALLSNTSGVPGNLTVTGSLAYTGSNNNPVTVNFNQGVQGKNAALTVDGIPISSASNTVNNVISGVTLNLNSVATGGSTVNLTVSPDTTQASSAVNAFVSAYNTAIQAINAQFNVSSDGSGGGPLEADGSLREAQGSLLAAIAYSTGNNTAFTNLASLGINLNNDGTLTVDNGALSSALSQNPSAVQSFFQTATAGFAANLTNVLNSLVGPGNGVLTLDAQGITQSSQGLGQQISDLRASLAIKQQNLIQTYAQVNTTLQELPLLESQMSQQLAGIA